MKKVVTIYVKDNWEATKPFNNPGTKKSFEFWQDEAIKDDVELYRASYKWFDAEKGAFIRAWTFRSGKWEKINELIEPDMIFDKTQGSFDHRLYDWKKELSKKYKIVNSPEFRLIFNNKLSQYLIFSQYMPKTVIINRKEDVEHSLQDINTRVIVVKPLYGSGGSGILIGDRHELGFRGVKYPVIVQEFIETKGVPGISEKGEVADLRLVFTNNKLVYCLSRIAKQGSYFTNFHQGGRALLVDVNQVPKSVKELTEKIKEKLDFFSGSMYSIDYMFGLDGKPYLIEVNTTPGFDLLEDVGTEEIRKANLTEFLKLIP